MAYHVVLKMIPMYKYYVILKLDIFVNDAINIDRLISK